MYETKRNIYKMGRRRGYNYGVFAIQDTTYESAEYKSIGLPEDDEDALEGLQVESAYDCEQMDRSFSPFELIAYELNNHETLDMDTAWDTFEEGIDVGVEIAFYLKHRALRKSVRQYTHCTSQE